ncbi:MAG: TetR/AcrR family transcriptional regulator [Gammaproteobacteria bacterium]|nr:TetR/AcrR family transcriptional regulator [Gammaproteobacteria bacterium]
MPRRLKANERRASILAVAKVLFADKGYNGVAVDEIARRLGVSPAVLYQHFPSKEALYDEVLSYACAERESYIDAALKGPDDFGSVLERMALVFAEKLASDSDYLRMEMQAALEDAPAAQQFFENRWKSFADFIEYSIKELAQQGQLGHINPRIASLMYQGMLREALYSKLILKSERFKQFSLPDLIKLMTSLFLNAIDFHPQT